MLTIFKKKDLYIGLLVSFLVIGLFAFAQVGARSTVKVRHLPLALVVNDHGSAAQKVVQKLQDVGDHRDATIKWVAVKHTSQLTKGFAAGKYYGAVVLHSGFSQALRQQVTYLKGQVMTQELTAITTKAPLMAQAKPFQQQQAVARTLVAHAPQQARLTLYVSQGNNAVIASQLMTRLPQLATQMNQTIAKRYGQVATQAKLPLTAQQWADLQTPINVTLVKRNSVSTKMLSGMAPMIITIFAWLGSLLASFLSWRAHRKFEQRRNDGYLSASSVTSQLIAGLVIAMSVAGTIYFFTKVCYGMPIPQPVQFFWLTTLISLVFYLLQTAVLNLLGIKGWPLLLVIWIGSMAVITMVPQMLSPFYQDFVYNWTPIRFAYDLFTNQLYLRDATVTGQPLRLLLAIGAGSILGMYGSTLLRK